MNQKTKYITGIVLSVLVICALTIPAFALTESDVQSQVSASGKEGVAGNLFVWFLCAVAFLKISQKIDSFMQGLGINVGHTGGSMLAEAMLAARSIAAARGVAGRGRGGNAGRAGITGGGDSNTFLQGGLAGVANRSFYNGAYRNATGTGSGGVGGMAFRASMTKGGDIANILTNGLRYAHNQLCLTCRPDKRNVIIRIQDDGDGIAEGDLPHIFERFYMGKSGKSGIGLALTKEIIHVHKGTIHAYNGDSGAVFEITLPMGR